MYLVASWSKIDHSLSFHSFESCVATHDPFFFFMRTTFDLFNEIYLLSKKKKKTCITFRYSSNNAFSTINDVLKR